MKKTIYHDNVINNKNNGKMNMKNEINMKNKSIKY